MKRRFLALVLAGCLAAVLSTAAWAMSPTGFYLNVELPSGETIALDAESGDSIDNIKGKLETKTKIAAGEQHLYYGGNLLVDGRTLANYNIQKGSTLLLTTKIKGTPAGEKLTEENMSGSTIGAPVTISEKTLNSGTYYLCNNVKLTQALVIQGDVTLDLNGFVLQHENRDANDSVIQMDSGTLTLVDSNPDAIHKFVKEATGLWTLNENAGTEIVKGGVITGGIGREHSFSSVYGSISENGGGGVFINQDASFVMEGGNIVGCSAVGEHNTAGGVLVARSASFVMKAGKIAGCTAARGGGVYVADRDGDYALGSFTMNGGTIEWCVAYGSAAYDDGGGVNNLGSFTMNGGTIRNCTAAYGYGGGISSLRNITISTVGPVNQLKKLREEHLKIQLTISLHAATQAARNCIIPHMHMYAIEDVVKQALSYSQRHNRKVVFAYLLLPGINDRSSDIRQLAKWFKGKNVMINVLQYNPTSNSKIRAPQKQEMVAFKHQLEQTGLEVTMRVSHGREIKAACGQLANTYNKAKKQQK